ncbi:hypothetical protein D3C76_1796640 [compost metagenome]
MPEAAQLQVIADCAEQDNYELPVDLDVAHHRQRVAAIEPIVRDLYEHWAAQRQG